MYSYEKQSLHYKVIADTLEKAAKIARKISGYYVSEVYPSEKAESAKKRLKELLLNILSLIY